MIRPFLILIVSFFLTFTSKADDVDVNTAILFMVDVSSSMDTSELKIARESHADGIKSQEVLNIINSIRPAKIAAAYLEFGESTNLHINWRIISDYKSAVEFSDTLKGLDPYRTNDNTSIGNGLAAANKAFEELPFKALRLVVDVAGDGYNNTGMSVEAPRQVLLNRGIVINGLPMMLSPALFPADSPYTDLTQYYMHEIIGGRGASLFPLSDINDMPMIVRQKMAQELF